MALSEGSRSAIFRGLRSLIDEEALGEMMSYFPARDVEEPVTKEFLTLQVLDLGAEIATVRADLGAEIAAVRADLGAEIATIRTDLGAEIAAVRADLGAEIAAVRADLSARIAGLSAEIAELRGEMVGIKHLLMFNAVMMVSLVAVIVAAIRL